MDSKNIFVWSPFTSKIGTISNVVNSSYSLIKFSKLKSKSVNNIIGLFNKIIISDIINAINKYLIVDKTISL